MMLSIISGIITIIALLLLIIKIKSDRLKLYNEKVAKAEGEIQILLENKLSLLINLQNTVIKEEKLKDIKLNINENFNNDYFKLNSILNQGYKDIKKVIESKSSYKPSKTIEQALDDIKIADAKCTAVKEYYNKNAIIINKMLNKPLSRIIAKTKKIETYELYNDPIEIEFEILKKK